MIILNWSSSFKKSYKKTIKNNPTLENKILQTMKLLQQDPFLPKLKTHKLKGILEDNWACYVDYDLRIVFDFVKSKATNETEILLMNIGSHDEVY
ncbi:MAG: type II toxin-antitoxin system RelE/ParE family toxin [Ignavibacteriaceae bacterium]